MKNLRIGLLIVLALALVLGGTAMAKKYSSLKGPWIGVYTQEIDDDVMEAFDLDRATGALIIDIIDDSPADEAGLRSKDIIISFNGEKVTGHHELTDLVKESDVGDAVEVVYIRGSKEKTATIEVGRRPKSEDRDVFIWSGNSPHSITRSFTFSDGSHSYIGTAVQNLNDQLGEYFGVEDGEGVLVTEVFEDSPAEEAGIKAGDVIISADGESVAETDELIDIITGKEEGDVVEIVYLRRGQKNTVKVEVDEDSTGLNAFSFPGFNFRMPKISTHGLSHFGDDDDYFDTGEYREAMDEYRDQMKAYQKEMEEMKKELQEIRKKLD